MLHRVANKRFRFFCIARKTRPGTSPVAYGVKSGFVRILFSPNPISHYMQQVKHQGVFVAHCQKTQIPYSLACEAYGAIKAKNPQTRNRVYLTCEAPEHFVPSCRKHKCPYYIILYVNELSRKSKQFLDFCREKD